MNRLSVFSWIGAATLCIGFAGTAKAESYDRDHEVGRDRAQDFRHQASTRDAMPARPSVDQSVTGRSIGRDTVTEGNIGREFKNAADVTAHMNTATKLRATSGGEAAADGSAAISAQRRVDKPSSPAEFNARQVRGNQPQDFAEEESTNLHESQITSKSVTGRKLGQDTVVKGMQYRNFKDRADMMAHLNVATQMRISGESGAEGETTGGGTASAGSKVSNPTRISDRVRKLLADEGLVLTPKQSAADVEDKTM